LSGGVGGGRGYGGGGGSGGLQKGEGALQWWGGAELLFLGGGVKGGVGGGWGGRGEGGELGKHGKLYLKLPVQPRQLEQVQSSCHKDDLWVVSSRCSFAYCIITITILLVIIVLLLYTTFIVCRNKSQATIAMTVGGPFFF
jgi:hypothetical protein